MTVGRPPKFDEPSSPVTVTLPSRILQQLMELDGDRGKAIVKCVEGFSRKKLSKKKVEIVKISENRGLIIIGRCRCLESLPWLRMVEIAPARFLLSFLPGTDVTSLEVAIMDLLEHNSVDDEYERGLLEELRLCIARHRRQEMVTKGEILFVDLNNSKKSNRSWMFALPLQAGIECLQFLIDYPFERMKIFENIC